MIDVEAIDNLLPQTQCGECGYAGCKPYAQALALGQASIDHCPPGGVTTLQALGRLLKVDAAPYLEQMTLKTRPPQIALIREEDCIGCTKCIQACPVDAIIGSAKRMHHILSHECTGCGLCVEPCPVDCIDMQTIPSPLYDKDLARQRFQQRKERLLQEAQEKELSYQKKRLLSVQTNCQSNDDAKAKQDYIQQALSRVKSKQGRT